MKTLKMEILPDGRRGKLLEDYLVVIDHMDIVVPKGFVTDFASVPRLFWRILPPWGKYSPAAVVHDYLYATGIVSKDEADDIFLLLMKRLRVSTWKRFVMFRAVKYFGFAAWNAHRDGDGS